MSLAHSLFENLIDKIGDKDLEEMVSVLKNYHAQYPQSYKNLKQIPFVQDLFDIIQDQLAYRNQEISGLSTAEMEKHWNELEKQEQEEQNKLSTEDESIKENYTAQYVEYLKD